MEIKKTKRGWYSVTITTEHGTRSINTQAYTREECDQIIKDSKLAELELAAKSVKLTQIVISQIMAGRKITFEETLRAWERWMDSGNMKEKSAQNFYIATRAWLKKQDMMDRLVGTLTAQDIDKFINNRQWKAKGSTKEVALHAIRSFVRFCAMKGYIYGDPSGEVVVKHHLLDHDQMEPKEIRLFTDDEVERVTEATAPGGPHEHPFWHVAVPLARYTGLRLSDIAQLEWASLRTPGKLVVWTRKRNKRVEHEFKVDDDKLRTILLSIPANESKYCFPEEQHFATYAPERSKLSTRFGRLLAELEIRGKSFHSLRHTYITDCHERGIPIPHISKLVGHSHGETTEGYIHPSVKTDGQDWQAEPAELVGQAAGSD